MSSLAPRTLGFWLGLGALGASVAGYAWAPTLPDAPRRDLPKIDFHTHYFRAPSTLVPLLKRWNMRAVVINYTNGDPAETVRQRWAGMVANARTAPAQFVLCTTIDPREAGTPGYAARTVAQLQRDIRDGAVLVKVWKDFGMAARDETGKFLEVDDPRLQPIWDFLAEQGIPVIAHLADPSAAWEPLDSTSPHYAYYREFPRYHAYGHPEMPSRATILAAQETWLRRNPRLIVIGAHLANMAEDLDSLSRLLEAFPNLSVDLAGRIKVLRRQPNARARTWMIRHGTRILFGSDLELDPPQAGSSAPSPAIDGDFVHERLLRDWRYLADTLALPDATLERIMHHNAARVLAKGESARTRLLNGGGPAVVRLSDPVRQRVEDGQQPRRGALDPGLADPLRQAVPRPRH